MSSSSSSPSLLQLQLLKHCTQNDAGQLAAVLEKNDVDINYKYPDLNDTTLLHVATSGNHLSALHVLLKHGADPNVLDGFGYAPLHSCIVNNKQGALDILLSYTKASKKTKLKNVQRDISAIEKELEGLQTVQEKETNPKTSVSVSTTTTTTTTTSSSSSTSTSDSEQGISTPSTTDETTETAVDTENTAANNDDKEKTVATVNSTNDKEDKGSADDKQNQSDDKHQDGVDSSDTDNKTSTNSLSESKDAENAKGKQNETDETNEKKENAQLEEQESDGDESDTDLDSLLSSSTTNKPEKKQESLELSENKKTVEVTTETENKASESDTDSEEIKSLKKALQELYQKRDMIVSSGVVDLEQMCNAHNGQKVQTAFHLACYRGALQSMTKLVEAGANPATVDREGNHCLHFAAAGGVVPAIEFIFSLTKCPHIDATNDHGETALLKATFAKREECIHLLIKKGANINHKSDTDMTALKSAVYNGFTDMTRILVQAGADIHDADESGTRVIHFAATMTYHEIVQILINAGADVNQMDAKSKTPLDCALQADSDAIAELLKLRGINARQVEDSRFKTIELLRKLGAREGAMVEYIYAMRIQRRWRAYVRKRQKMAARHIESGSDASSSYVHTNLLSASEQLLMIRLAINKLVQDIDPENKNFQGEFDVSQFSRNFKAFLDDFESDVVEETAVEMGKRFEEQLEEQRLQELPSELMLKEKGDHMEIIDPEKEEQERLQKEQAQLLSPKKSPRKKKKKKPRRGRSPAKSRSPRHKKPKTQDGEERELISSPGKDSLYAAIETPGDYGQQEGEITDNGSTSSQSVLMLRKRILSLRQQVEVVEKAKTLLEKELHRREQILDKVNVELTAAVEDNHQLREDYRELLSMFNAERERAVWLEKNEQRLVRMLDIGKEYHKLRNAKGASQNVDRKLAFAQQVRSPRTPKTSSTASPRSSSGYRPGKSEQKRSGHLPKIQTN